MVWTFSADDLVRLVDGELGMRDVVAAMRVGEEGSRCGPPSI